MLRGSDGCSGEELCASGMPLAGNLVRRGKKIAVTGRPRDSRLQRALIESAASLIVEQGYAAVTIDAVVKRAGTTKPAFYRRYSGLAAMIPAIIAARHDEVDQIDTGDLRGDLQHFQQVQAEIFDDPFVRHAMAGWLVHLASHHDDARDFHDNFLAPRLAVVRTMFERAHRRDEIDQLPDPQAVMDILVGPMLMRTLMPGLGAVDAEVVTRTVDTALRHIG